MARRRRPKEPPDEGVFRLSTPLLQQSAFLAALLANAPVGISMLDTRFRYLMINEILAESHGIAVAEHLGKTVEEVSPGLWERIEPLLRTVLEGHTIVNREVTLDDGDPQRAGRLWLASYYPLRVDGAVTGIGCIIIEITERREIERDLRLRTNLYAMLSRANRAVSRADNATDLFREVCEIAVEVGGFSFAWVGVPRGPTLELAASAGIDNGYLSELVISLDPNDERSQGPTGQAYLTGNYFVVNDLLATSMTAPWHELADRSGFASSASFPIREEGVVAAVLSVYSREVGFFSSEIVATMSEIMPALSFALDFYNEEKIRREDEERLRLHDRALNAISQGVVITGTGADHEIVYASPSFLRLTGYALTEVVGRNCRFLQGADTDAAAVATMHESIDAGEECTVEILNYRKDGSAFWNRVTVCPVRDAAGRVSHFVGVQTDITAERGFERQLLQAQKLEAIGALAGGIAHDFNNMLLVIRGYSALLAGRVDDEEVRELATRIDTAVQRAAEFTRRLLTFGHAQVTRPESEDVNTVVRETMTLLERIIGHDIALSVDLNDALPPIMIDRAQMEQALLNLVANARDAMPGGGTLVVTTSLADLGEGYSAVHAGVRPGPYVLLEVTDDGEGMDDFTQTHVFEPFFTTKEQGTGLGLSTVYGFVRQSGGHVAFHSERGRGTTFKLYFPVNADPRPRPRPRPKDVSVTTLEGDETILLVEDVEEARNLVARYLEGLGYTVISAANGSSALDAVQARSGPIDILLTDIVMPQLNGHALAERLVRLHPEVRIVFTSGFPSSEVIDVDDFAGRSVFIEKPYLLEDVARAVRGLLAGAAH